MSGLGRVHSSTSVSEYRAPVRRAARYSMLWVAGLTALTSACSSGGGSAVASAIQVQFSSAADDLPELDEDLQVEVRLDLTGPDPLDEPVSVLVRDSGNGTATSAADYVQVAATTLIFPAGALDGATASIVVTSISDALLEGPETLILELAAPTGGAAVGTSGSMTLSIVDQTAPGALEVMADAGAGATEVSSGVNVNFGDQQLFGGVGLPVTLTVENTGDLPVALSALTLSGTNVDDFVVTVDTSAAPATAALPVAGSKAVSAARTIRPTPLRSMGQSAELGTRLVLDPERLAALSGLDSVRLEGLALPQQDSVDLDLERLPSPWSDDAVVRVNGATRATMNEVTGGLSLWRGEVVGYPGSSVYLGLSSTGTRGWVQLSEDPVDMHYLVAETSTKMTPGGAECRLVQPHQFDPVGDAHLGQFCQGDLYPPDVEPELPFAVPATAEMPTAHSLLPAVCRVAFETDYQFLQNFPDSDAATVYVTQLLGAINQQYLEDVQTNLEGVFLSLWEVAGPTQDPWDASEIVGGTSDALLDEFELQWSPLNGGALAPQGIEYDVAHFLSGAALGGGIAYVDVLCNVNFNLGVSTEMTGTIDFANFTGVPDNLNWDFVVVAHEIGHNFSALHTHDYCPPLDNCQPTTNISCPAGVTCSRGTLMSYCHLCPGATMNIDLEFHPTVANLMRQAVNDSCLEQPGIASGQVVSFEIGFDPTSSLGSKSATLEFTHDATNVASPFQLDLAGNAIP